MTIRTPIKAIHAYCVKVCMLDNPREVPLCTCKECPLYPYRTGHRPEKSADNA